MPILNLKHSTTRDIILITSGVLLAALTHEVIPACIIVLLIAGVIHFKTWFKKDITYRLSVISVICGAVIFYTIRDEFRWQEQVKDRIVRHTIKIKNDGIFSKLNEETLINLQNKEDVFITEPITVYICIASLDNPEDKTRLFQFKSYTHGGFDKISGQQFRLKIPIEKILTKFNENHNKFMTVFVFADKLPLRGISYDTKYVYDSGRGISDQAEHDGANRESEAVKKFIDKKELCIHRNSILKEYDGCFE